MIKESMDGQGRDVDLYISGITASHSIVLQHHPRTSPWTSKNACQYLMVVVYGITFVYL